MFMNPNRATMATLGRCLLALISVCALESGLSAEPMVYTGLVVTDVRVGTTLFHNASLKLTFEGDTNDILQVPVPTTECTGSGYFLYLTKGVARMQIEFQGRTRTATLQDGQVFVAVDECNGGIGFGSFVGPNGLEPAYPLAFTMGTAEYDAITYSGPLADILTTTGSAWSCIGYPPGGAGNLPPTADGNCTPPDAYPLKSNIGDIFVYQPYFEYVGAGFTDIASNHSGSTNRGVFLARPKPTRTVSTDRSSQNPEGSGIVYTLQTVADGWIGNHAFYQALVTFRMISNRRSVTTQPSPVDPTKSLYENHSGYATVTVDDGGQIITASFAPGEVYVRYDTGAGVAGFGSQISPNYPAALNCSDSAYPSESNYTVDCLQGDAWNYINIGSPEFTFRSGILGQLNNPSDPSAGVAALPQSLSQDTILTGPVHACAGVYTINPNNLLNYLPGDLSVCAGPAPRGLHTSKGDLFLQDLNGGSLDLGNVVIVGNEASSDPGWDLANSGFLHVEVFRGDD
jgi:hypothetical protein